MISSEKTIALIVLFQSCLSTRPRERKAKKGRKEERKRKEEIFSHPLNLDRLYSRFSIIIIVLHQTSPPFKDKTMAQGVSVYALGSLLAGVVVAFYLLRRAVLPRPLKGIPYNADAAKKLFGDVPEMMGYVLRTKRIFVSFFFIPS